MTPTTRSKILLEYDNRVLSLQKEVAELEKQKSESELLTIEKREQEIEELTKKKEELLKDVTPEIQAPTQEVTIAKTEEKPEEVIEKQKIIDDGWFTPIILKEDDEKMIIAGYASVEAVDSQGEIIPVEALKDALPKFMEKEDYRNVMSRHSNVQVGKVLEVYKDSTGREWTTHVDDVGLFAVSEIRNDIQEAKKIRELIKNGDIREYSIGGKALDKTYVVKDGKPVKKINSLELYEITLCEKGANPGAKFQILKMELSKNISLEEQQKVDKMPEDEKKEPEKKPEDKQEEKKMDNYLTKEEFSGTLTKVLEKLDSLEKKFDVLQKEKNIGDSGSDSSKEPLGEKTKPMDMENAEKPAISTLKSEDIDKQLDDFATKIVNKVDEMIKAAVVPVEAPVVKEKEEEKKPEEKKPEEEKKAIPEVFKLNNRELAKASWGDIHKMARELK